MNSNGRTQTAVTFFQNAEILHVGTGPDMSGFPQQEQLLPQVTSGGAFTGRGRAFLGA
jgi:hypothetical protein